MKNPLPIILFLFIIFFFTNAQYGQGTWTKKADLTTPKRAGAVAFSIGDKGYVGTGSTTIALIPSSVLYNDFWEYDEKTNLWTQKADFIGGGRIGVVAFSIGNKGYIGTGATYLDIYNDFWEWDQAKNTWTKIADFPGERRSGAVGFSIGNKGYIGTGAGISAFCSPCADFWEYDPAKDIWLQKAPLPAFGRSNTVGFSIGNKGYIGTGDKFVVTSGVPNSELLKDFWEYDPLSDGWINKADFPGGARAEATGFSMMGAGYIGTGTSQIGSGSQADFWRYDPSSNSWSRIPDIGGGIREVAVAFVIGCHAYVSNGWINDGKPQNDLWLYSLCCDFQASLSVSPDITIDEGSSTQITVGEGYLYQWIPSTGLSCSTCSNPIAKPLTTTAYRVIISDNNGCSKADSVKVTVNCSFAISISPDITIDEGSSTQLTVSGGDVYQWNPSVGLSCSTCYNPIAKPVKTISYQAILTDHLGCSKVDSVKVTLKCLLSISLSPDITISKGDSTFLSASGGRISYSWSPSIGLNNVNGQSVQAKPTVTTTYTVITTSLIGCEVSNRVTVFVQKNCDVLFLPNALSPKGDGSIANVFTPNSDGVNDKLLIPLPSECLDAMVFEIYNRWGNMVYKWRSSDVAWDGRDTHGNNLSEGIYYYILTGEKLSGDEILLKGFIELLRN